MPVGSTHSPIGYLDNRAKKRLWITIMSTNRISTGIEELDILMKGGFRSGGTYLVLGQPGTGKTIFGLQFLYRGLLDDQKVIYVAINENPAALIEQATSVGWNLLPYIENNQCLLLRPSAYLNREKLRESDIQQIIEDLNGRIQQTGATRVVIDPLRPLLFTSNSHSLVDDHARIFFNLMQSNAKTNDASHRSSCRPQCARHRGVSSRRDNRPGDGAGKKSICSYPDGGEDALH